MGELLTIGVGGTGCRIAESFWEMALSHHLQQPESSLPSTLFKDSKNARTVLVDYDAYDLNAIQKRMH
jgi:cell division GTPase FtsZ